MPQSPRKISEQRLEPFFNHWLDFETTDRGLRVPNGLGDEGDGVALMPSMYWHPAVREFYRCVELYRVYAPHWYWYLAAFYKCEWRQMRRVNGKKWDREIGAWAPTYGAWSRERVLPSAWSADDQKRVGTGVRFVAQLWDLDIDPSLPTELIKAA